MAQYIYYKYVVSERRLIMVVVWIVVLVAALLVEAATFALVSIWFVPAALLTCLVSLVVDSFLIQVLVFVILSIIAMIISRKVYKKYIKKDKKMKLGSRTDIFFPYGEDRYKKMKEFGFDYADFCTKRFREA